MTTHHPHTPQEDTMPDTTTARAPFRPLTVLWGVLVTAAGAALLAPTASNLLGVTLRVDLELVAVTATAAVGLALIGRALRRPRTTPPATR